MDSTSFMTPNPIRLLGKEPAVHFPQGGFGAVLARAGVGKTAVLVQIGINGLLEAKNVLHVSLNEPVRKVCLWYEEVFSNVAERFGVSDASEVWETLVPHRFIMTFSAGGFTVPLLSQRVSDLVEQGIFSPEIVLLDGLNFDADVLKTLEELREFARANDLRIWFAVRTHRAGSDPTAAILKPYYQVAGLFDVALFLDAAGTEILVRALQGGKDPEESRSLVLDSATLLIKDKV